MTTHALSLTVDVSGSLFHDDPEIMRNVSVDFTLHREGPDDAAYKNGVNLTEKELGEKMDKRPIGEGKSLPTRFTYRFIKESGEKAANMGIKNVRANAAQTMLFCPSIRSIEVIDEINNLTFSIKRENCEARKDSINEVVFIEESSDRITPIKRIFISTEIEEYSEPLSIHWKTKNRNLRLNVAVEVDEKKNVLPISSTSPAVYCSLPLIGFERMSLPYYINSNDFEPTTERTSLHLRKKRSEIRTNEDSGLEEKFYLQSGINWSILERSISLYEKIVDYLIENDYKQRYNLISGLGGILKGSWETETKNCLASRFILPLCNMLVGKNLVKTAKDYRSIKSDVKFAECAKECDLHAFYNICETIYGTDLAIEEENQKWVSLKWGRFSFEEDFDEKIPSSETPAFPTIKYKDIAEFIERAETLANLQLNLSDDNEASIETTGKRDVLFVKAKKLEWLNKFYEWIETSKITNLSDKKIVPNRLGEFCSTEQGCDLKDASDISTAIFDFMKQISLDWDRNLLMEGVSHVSLAKETMNNVTSAIKNRIKEICESVNDNDEIKLAKLLPILMALPVNEEEKIGGFLKKRKQIVSILKVMYASTCEEKNTSSLDLKAEAWEYADKWFMNLVASTIADREHLDVINTGDTEEEIKVKYCTSEWLSETLNFMFQNNYLHQEDVTSKDDKNNVLSLIPNRYGNFCPINELHTQGQISDELLNDALNKTGYDIKKRLLYKDFALNEKVAITDLSIYEIATKYNEFFDNEKESDNEKETVAKYLVHLVPECGNQFSEIRKLYDEYNKAESETISISTSDLNIWKGAKNFLISFLAKKVSGYDSIYEVGKHLKDYSSNSLLLNEQLQECKNAGMDWLNRLAKVIKDDNFTQIDDFKIIPDWDGCLHIRNEIIYNGLILSNYKRINLLIDGIINSDLWKHNEDIHDRYLISTIAHPEYCFASEFQNNTNAKLFQVVDELISYCCDHNDTSWRPLLKKSIESLLRFFDENSSSGSEWIKFFSKTYERRKELSYDYIYDQETKARFSQMNDNYSLDEIEKLIQNKDLFKKMLESSNYITIQKIMDEFPDTDFNSILSLLRSEQGDFKIERFQQNISENRKQEIGDKGECFVYEMLCRWFDTSNIKWSNNAPNDDNARTVYFNGKVYRLNTTSHDFDFVVSHNGKTIYIEVKTTVGSIRTSKDFPLIFEAKEWEWIDANKTDDSQHYIVRVFDIEGSPKAYFLKQELKIKK